MPTSIEEQLADKIWALLEARTELTAILLAGNRLKQSGDGWLRERISRAPNDFPQIQLTAGKFTGGNFDQPMTFGMETSGYPGAEAGWLTRERGEFTLTITGKDLKSTSVAPVEEQVRAALILAGTHWGLSFLLNWGPLTSTPREAIVGNQARLQRKILIPLDLEFLGRTAILGGA